LGDFNPVWIPKFLSGPVNIWDQAPQIGSYLLGMAHLELWFYTLG